MPPSGSAPVAPSALRARSSRSERIKTGVCGETPPHKRDGRSDVPNEAWGSLLDTFKKKTVLLEPITRHLLCRPAWAGREIAVIHPSDVVYDDACMRAVYFRITTGVVHEDTNLVRETIFAEGHEYHRKWQGWAWDIGVLEGNFLCHHCTHEWYAVAPPACAECGAVREHLEYREVPVALTKPELRGHADGILAQDKRRVLEIKSIGLGTVRMYAPELVIKHTHKIDGRTVVDVDAIWKEIKQPFLSHVKQVNLYCHALGIEEAVFIYEYKPNGQSKEFTVTATPAIYEPLLKKAKDLLDAIKWEDPPKCNVNGKRRCKECKPYEDQGQEDTGSRKRGGRAGGADGPAAADDATGRDPSPAGGRDGAVGLGADEPVPTSGVVAELRQRSTRGRRNAGGVRREVHAPGRGRAVGVRAQD